MKKINSSQRSYLKSQAHHLDPVVIIGKSGLNNGTLHSINIALSKLELIKIKFRDHKDDKHDLSEKIALETSSIIINMIGHVLMLYREHSDPDKRKFTLH